MTELQNKAQRHPLALRRVLTAGVLLGLASGCVSTTAGYQDVSTLTYQRLGTEIKQRSAGSGAHGAGATPSAEVAELLKAPLTAERAARVALLNSPTVNAELERIGIARAELTRALRLPNPHVGGALLYGHDGAPEVELDAMISLSAFLFLPARDGVASAALSSAALEVTASLVNLAYATRRDFFAYQAALARLELTHTALSAFGAAADMAQRLFDAGNITELRLASERALYEQARIEHSRAEAAAAAVRESVSARLGLSGKAGTAWTAQARLPEPEAVDSLIQDIEAYAIEQSLDIQAAVRRYEGAAKGANAARFQGWFPELSAGVAAERSEDGWAFGPAAEISVPLFYQGQGEHSAAIAQMRQQQARAQQAALDVRSRARQLAVNLQTTYKMIQHYQSAILPLREQVLEQAQLQYNAMNLGVFELLQAKRDQVSAGASYLDLVQEYWMLRSDLEQLRAGGLPAGSVVAVSAAPVAESAGGGH